MLKDAYKNYTKRGTIAGIQHAIAAYAGVANAGIIEDFRLRQWAALPATQYLCGGLRLWSRGVYDRLQVGEHSRIGQFHLVDTTGLDVQLFLLVFTAFGYFSRPVHMMRQKRRPR